MITKVKATYLYANDAVIHANDKMTRKAFFKEAETNDKIWVTALHDKVYLWDDLEHGEGVEMTLHVYSPTEKHSNINLLNLERDGNGENESGYNRL
jgi:hypothetical protein